MGYIVLAGMWEPGSVVSLYGTADASVLRADGGSLVGRRLADPNGSVGFDGLEPGTYIASALLAGVPQEVRCRALTGSEGSDLAQPPAPAPVNAIGTQEAIIPDVPPAAPAAILHVGIPAGLPIGAAVAA